MIPEAREPRQLADMTWEEARDLDRGKTVAVLPVGAIEAHGPHLPLATDGLIAEAMARDGADNPLPGAGREGFGLNRTDVRRHDTRKGCRAAIL